MCICTYVHMQLDLGNTATYSYSGNFIVNQLLCQWINWLSEHHLRKLTALLCWGLFLRPVRHSLILVYPVIAAGWLLEAATLLELTIHLVDHISYRFNYIFSTKDLVYITLKSVVLYCNLPLYDAPLPPITSTYIGASGADKNYLKWQEIWLAGHCTVGSLIDFE